MTCPGNGMACPGVLTPHPHSLPPPPQVRNVPVWLLKGTRSLLRSFQWAGDAADRLAFAEVLSSNESFSADMSEWLGGWAGRGAADEAGCSRLRRSNALCSSRRRQHGASRHGPSPHPNHAPPPPRSSP